MSFGGHSRIFLKPEIDIFSENFDFILEIPRTSQIPIHDAGVTTSKGPESKNRSSLSQSTKSTGLVENFWSKKGKIRVLKL